MLLSTEWNHKEWWPPGTAPVRVRMRNLREMGRAHTLTGAEHGHTHGPDERAGAHTDRGRRWAHTLTEGESEYTLQGCWSM